MSTRQTHLPPRCPIQKKTTVGPINGSIAPSPPVNEFFLHHDTSSSVLEDEPVWLDELLSDRESNSKGQPLRRSASDSVTLLDGLADSLRSLCIVKDVENSVGNEACGQWDPSCIYGPNSPRRKCSSDFSNYSMVSALSEFVHLHHAAPVHTDICSIAENSSSNLNGDMNESVREVNSDENAAKRVESTFGEDFSWDDDHDNVNGENSHGGGSFKDEEEMEGERDVRIDIFGLMKTSCIEDVIQIDGTKYDGPWSFKNETIFIDLMDEEVVKGNRQEPPVFNLIKHNGQRSRVRKLQYIAELERKVNVLQTVESQLGIRVASLLQERVALSMENRKLKQQVARVRREKLTSEGRHQALKKEVEKLKLLSAKLPDRQQVKNSF